MTLRSPLLPSGVDRFMFHLSSGSTWASTFHLALEDAAGQDLVRLFASGYFCIWGADGLTCSNDGLTPTYERIDIKLVGDGFDASYAGHPPLHARALGSGAPAFIRIETQTPVSLGGFRVHAPGATCDASFREALAPPTGEAYGSINVPLFGLDWHDGAHWNGAYDAGYVQVDELGIPGDLAFVACPAPLGPFIAQVAYMPFTGTNPPDGAAVLAGLSGSSGPGDVAWSIIMVPTPPRPILGPADGTDLMFRDATGTETLLAHLGERGVYRFLQVTADPTAGTLDIVGVKVPPTHLEGVPAASRIAVGDVFTAPYIVDATGERTGTGAWEWDDLLVAPLAS